MIHEVRRRDQTWKYECARSFRFSARCVFIIFLHFFAKSADIDLNVPYKSAAIEHSHTEQALNVARRENDLFSFWLFLSYHLHFFNSIIWVKFVSSFFPRSRVRFINCAMPAPRCSYSIIRGALLRSSLSNIFALSCFPPTFLPCLSLAHVHHRFTIQVWVRSLIMISRKEALGHRWSFLSLFI